MRLLALLFVTAFLAGCSGSQVQPDPAPTAEEPATSGHPLWVFDGNGTILDAAAFPGQVPSFEQIEVSQRISGEPTIGVTRTGAVFYPSIAFDSGVPGVQGVPTTTYFRSIDGGDSWHDFSPHAMGQPTHLSSFDPYVYVDPTTGRVFAMDMGPHVACNQVSWSDDDGKTWMTRPGACPLPLADHPTLFAGPKVGPLAAAAPAVEGASGYPNNIYLCSNQIADVQCSLSIDGGLNWLPSEPVWVGVDAGPLVEDPESLDWLCGSLHGHGHASWADGTVYLGRGYCGEPQVAISHDGGVSYETVTISSQPQHRMAYHHDVSIGTDASGTAYAFWLGNGDTQAFLSVSKDQGRTWSEPMNVTAPGVTAVTFPSLVAGSDGRVAFQYVGTQTPSGWAIHSAGDNETLQAERLNATWNAYVTVSLDAANQTPVFAATTANDVAKPLKRGDCWDRCQGGDGGGEGGMYDFLDIDIDPMTGQIWSALVDVCTEACDEPGANAQTFQRAYGAVGKQVGGTFLLSEPIPAR